MRRHFTYFLLLFLSIASVEVGAQVWEAVGNPAGISAGNAGRLSMVNDSNDNMYVGYYDPVIKKGNVQKFDGTSWDYLGNTNGVTDGIAAYSSTVVDSAGRVYFSYQGSGLETVKFDNNSWSAIPKATEAGVSSISSFVGPNNTLYVISGENSGTVRKFSNGVWVQVGTTGIFGDSENFIDVAVGSNGKVYVSFTSEGYVHVYENSVNADTNQAWVPTGGVSDISLAAGGESYNSGIAIDKDNNLYLMYVSNASQGNMINVKKFNGTSWSQLGNANFSPNRLQHTSIAVNDKGIYVAGSRWEDNDFLKNLVFGYDPQTNTWKQVGTGFASVGQATYNSLAIDSKGNLFLAFVDSGLGKLSVKKLNLAIVAAESVTVTTESNAAPEITTDNGTIQLKTTVTPVNANQNVLWTVEEGSGFATVSNTGLVTAISSNAVVKIKAASAENVSIFGTIRIAIKNQDSDVVAESMTLKPATVRFADISGIGKTLQLVASALPVESDQKFTWSISSGDAVTVNQSGLVTSVKEGKSFVKAVHIDGTLSKEIEVNVYASGCTQGNYDGVSTYGFNITEGIYKGADDIIIPQGTRFAPKKFRFYFIGDSTTTLSKIDLKFLKNDAGQPGKLYKEQLDLDVKSITYLRPLSVGNDTRKVYMADVDIPEGLYLDNGKYWINIIAKTQGDMVYWLVTTDGGIGDSYYADSLVGHNWFEAGGGGFNGQFEISGNCTTMPVIVSTVNGGSADVLMNQTLALKATVNTTGSTAVNWSVVEGSQYLSVDSQGTVTGIKAGTATVRATLQSDNNTYGEFVVNVINPNACGRESDSNELENAVLFGGELNRRTAMDFEVGENVNFKIESVEPNVFNNATYFKFKFYTDKDGLPGQEISTVDGTIVHDKVIGSNFTYFVHTYKVELNTPQNFGPGKYWMEIESDALAWETTTASMDGNPVALYNDNSNGEWFSSENLEAVYKINSVCTQYLAVNENNKSLFSFYPNPVKDYLNIKADKVIQNVIIYNLAGQLVTSIEVDNSTSKLNLSSLKEGVYILNVTYKDGETKSSKIIKN